MAEDLQTSIPDDFRRRFIEAVADGEAPDLDALRLLAADDPWRYREALAFASDALPGGGLLFVAHAFAADHRGDLAQAALLWRVAAQDRIPLARVRLEELERDGVRAVPDVSASVRGVLAGQLAVGGLVTPGGLAMLLQDGHGRLGGGRLADVRFDDAGSANWGVARPAVAWLADAYVLYAEGPLTVLDTSVLLLHLADRDAGVAQALGANGCAAALRTELAASGQELRSWRPATDDVLGAGPGEPRDESIVDRSGAGPVLVGTGAGLVDEPLYATIRPDGAVSIEPFTTGLTRTRRARTSPVVADGMPAMVSSPAVLAVGADDDEPVVAVGGRGGELGVWWPNRGRLERGPADPDGLICLTIGDAAGPVVVSGDAAGRVQVTRLHDGEPVISIATGSPVRDLDAAILDGRPVLAVLDESSELTIWDLADVRPVTSARHVIGGIARVRFGHHGDAPALLVRQLGGAPEVRRLAWVRVADEVPEYRSDATSHARELPLGDDALGREAEADAIAELITSASVQPPLAIGLFGEWGEGKSWFMERIQAYVDDRARRAATAPEGAPTVACRHVKQVRFNAWHYAETDLWASLVAEMFNQLGRTADGEELRRQARLRAELVRRTKVPERLAEVQAYLASTEDRDLLPAYGDLPDTVRDRWIHAVGPVGAEAIYGRLNHSAGALQRRVTGPLAVAWAVARARPVRTFLLAAAVLAVLGVVALAAVAWWGRLAAVVTTVAGAIAVGTPLVRSVARRAVAGWDVLRSAARQVSVLDTTRAVAQAEAEQLQEEYERLVAGGQLAGVLEQRVRDGSYRSRLGLMSQIRDDFSEMAELLDSRSAPADGDGEYPNIDRIALYVDDLDRCPPGRVVEVLEAIHLLLAVRLFVVVVAVDPRWLLQALTTHYRGLLQRGDGIGPGDDDLWRSTPLHYLEKIFQVPFTLSPLDVDRYERFVDGLLTPVVSSPPVTPSPATADVSGDQRVRAVADGGRPASGDAGAPVASHVAPRLDMPLRLPPAPRNEQIDPLLLDDVERAFIKLLGPPLLTSPRSTKRLLNSYGLLLSLEGAPGRRAMLVASEADDGVAVTSPPCRPALTLLAAVIARPDASPAFFRHLHEADPDKEWLAFLDDEDIRLGGADLAEVLARLTRGAASAGQALPGIVAGFQPWVVKAGRLSFQTGREVVRLG